MFERFPHLRKLRTMTADQMALALIGVEPIGYESIEEAKREEDAKNAHRGYGFLQGSDWNKAKAHRQALMQAAIRGEIESESYLIFDTLGDCPFDTIWVNAPVPINMSHRDILNMDLVVASAQRWFNADTEADKEPTTAEPTLNGLPPLSGESYQKLLSAYQAFPIQYPKYQTTPVKLNKDAHDWIRVKFSCNDKEMHAFLTIIYQSLGIK